MNALAKSPQTDGDPNLREQLNRFVSEAAERSAPLRELLDGGDWSRVAPEDEFQLRMLALDNIGMLENAFPR